MGDYIIMKAVEFGKLPSKFRKQYADENALLDAGWWLQRKYDGCMGIAQMSMDRPPKMVSRTGEDYTASCGHILATIHEAAMADGPYDDFNVIGEVWQPIDEAAFPEISGKFRRQSPSPELRFVMNDILPLGFNTTRPYEQRFLDLRGIAGGELMVADTHVFHGFHWEGEATRLALKWQGEGGFDGAIMRDPKAGYTVGTVKAGEIVKIKPTLSLDLAIVDIKTVPGEKTGRDVWSIEVEYKGVRSWVGSGMPHGDPIPGGYLYSVMNPVIAEIECLGITADGKLREPRYKGLRHDKVEPDA